MVYKLDDADKLCGVAYIDWSKKYSPIPKATCDMIQPKCSSGGGSDNTPELSCEDIKKLLKGEEKPKEDTPVEDNTEVNLLEIMPKVEDNFSVVTNNNGIITSITENSPEQKEAFERKIITILKSKLPEGATVEAVLGEPYYKEGSELITGKTNYTIHTRVTLNGKVYEQDYNVPTIFEEQSKAKEDDVPKEVKELFNFDSIYSLFVTRGDHYRAMYLREDTVNTLNGKLESLFPSSNFLTYKDIFTIDDIYIKEKLDRDNEPKTVTMVVNLTLYNGKKKTLEIPRTALYIDGENVRPDTLNPNLPLLKSEEPDANDKKIIETIDNHEFYYGNITPTSDGHIGSLVGNNGKPITSEELENQSEVFSNELKKVLGDKVFRVRVDLVQLLHVGDYIGENRTEFHSAFRVDITLYKENRSRMTLSELATTSVTETL